MGSPILENAAEPVKCPCCHAPTRDLKCLRFAHWMVFLVLYLWVAERVTVACPRCMRRILARRLALNVVPANLAWPALLILYVPRFAATFEPGPSRVLTDVPREPGRVGRALLRVGRFLELVGEHVFAYVFLSVVGACAAFMAFTGRHDGLDASRVIFAAT